MRSETNISRGRMRNQAGYSKILNTQHGLRETTNNTSKFSFMNSSTTAGKQN